MLPKLDFICLRSPNIWFNCNFFNSFFRRFNLNLLIYSANSALLRYITSVTNIIYTTFIHYMEDYDMFLQGLKLLESCINHFKYNL